MPRNAQAMANLPTQSSDVVVGVDGSDNSESALLWAADWCRRNDSQLRVVLARTHPPQYEWLAFDALRATAMTATVERLPLDAMPVWTCLHVIRGFDSTAVSPLDALAGGGGGQ